MPTKLDWSKQSPHIHTLYAPWQPGNGYDEALIAAAEERIGSQLPTPLRTFYRAWGRRKDLTLTNQAIVEPDKLARLGNALIFCVENQGGYYWAIQQKALEDSDPPVVRADADEAPSSLVWELSHAHVSDFLDSLAYQHAFWGGAIHGGSGRFEPQQFHQQWLKDHWDSIMTRHIAFPLMKPEDGKSPLYIREGLALDWYSSGCAVVARSREDLDEIGQVLQMTWTHRW